MSGNQSGQTAEGAWHPVAVALALVLLTTAVYLPSLGSGFIWDDDAYVTENRSVKSPAGLGPIWLDPASQVSPRVTQYYPLVLTTFWLEHRLWGLDPSGYHGTNVLLHALAALLLWRLLVRLRVPGAALAAALFAVHPVHVESVAWITERKNLLSGALYLGAALLFLRAHPIEPGSRRPERAGLFYAAALGLFVGALLSKTVTASLPAALLLVTWWKRGRLERRDVLAVLPMLVLGAISGLYTAHLERVHVGAQGPEWDLSFVERFLIAGRAVWFYLGKLVWPHPLAFVYPRWEVSAQVAWQYLFPASALVGVLGLWLARSRLGRAPVTAVLFFGGTLLPALGFFDVYPMRYSFVADHFQYLASLGPIVGACAGGALLLARAPARARGAVAVALLLMASALTWRQQAVYRDAVSLWQDTLAKNPAAWLAHLNLGVELRRGGDVSGAERHYLRALALRADLPEVHNNLGNLYLKQYEYEKARPYLEEALRLRPDLSVTQNRLGELHAGLRDDARALAYFDRAIELSPGFAAAHLNRARALERLGRIDDAVVAYRELVDLVPELILARAHLAGLLARADAGVPAAIAGYREVLRRNEDHLPAQQGLAWLLATDLSGSRRDGEEATRWATRAAAATGFERPLPLLVLAAAYAEAGRPAQAAEVARRAQRLAAAEGAPALVGAIEAQLARYATGNPYREAASERGDWWPPRPAGRAATDAGETRFDPIP